MIVKKQEFDLNHQDPDIECCKVCGQDFGAYDIHYVFKNVWSGDDLYIMCEECLKEAYKEISKYIL